MQNQIYLNVTFYNDKNVWCTNTPCQVSNYLIKYIYILFMETNG